LILSKACEYGVKAVICISINSQKGRKVNLKEVAKNIESPVAFTSKILQKLVKAGFVNSVKGARGGFEIKTSVLETLLLWDIVKEIDGVDITEKCLLGMRNCSNENPCPVHDKYKTVRTDILSLMKSTSIKELSQKVKEGESVLKN
jgi:Rrf2 family iron-sulfur cluster assembly transcriptional regulator